MVLSTGSVEHLQVLQKEKEKENAPYCRLSLSNTLQFLKGSRVLKNHFPVVDSL